MTSESTGGRGTAVSEPPDRPPAEETGPRESGGKPATPQITLSRTPKLASGVQLAGQMQESAFKDPPYLIQRDGQFIQTPELLYRIAEQIDGKRTVDEISERASAATQIELPPDETKQLLAKLFTMGVITDAQDKLVTEVFAPAMAEGYSPLTLNMRMAMIGPRLLSPITTVLRIFHWPPVLVGALAGAVAAHVWLYFLHGIGGGVHAAFYTPGLLLALIGLLLVAAVFHEFGHASALEYGGGKVKNMGVGLYMIYPAFYTDVTDSYRLPRWGRVRTDLGGLYFNLLFAVALIGIYWLTGAEFLLLVVALVNFEMLHQLLPLGRLDGYWTLADLIGMPDFFSRIVPFLRGILPGWVPLPEGQKLPELKTHAKIVFAAYITLAIPVLLFLLFLTLRAAPRILATGVDAFIEQSSTLDQAVRGADVLTAAGTIAQMGVLVLMTGGVVYLLARLGQRLATGLWNWGKPNMPRRIMSITVGAGVMLFLAYLWAPQLPDPPGGQGPAYQAASFEPVRKGERLTLGDAARNAVVVRDPRTGEFRQIDPAQENAGVPLDENGEQTPGQSSGGTDQSSGGTGQSGGSGSQVDPTPGSQADPGAVPGATPYRGGATATATPRATPELTPDVTPEVTIEPTATP